MNPSPTTVSLIGIDAAIFDLDGVLTDTASAHFRAWKQVFDRLLRRREGPDFAPFSTDDYRMYVDGKSRLDGAASFVQSRGLAVGGEPSGDGDDVETIQALAGRKNDCYQRFLDRGHVEVFDDAARFLDRLDEHGVSTGVVTSSKNGRRVLDIAGLADRFGARVDGLDLAGGNLAGKPAADMFLEAAGRLGAAADTSIVIEDAAAGVQAGRRGGFGFVIGLARTGQPDTAANELAEAGADAVITSFDCLDIETHGGDVTSKSAAQSRAVVDAIDHLDAIVDGIGDQSLAVFLDYDGTLSPIVDRADQAVLSTSMRQTIAAVSRRWPVAVVSGRDLDDVRQRVDLPDLAYAGSHGFDIAGPADDDIRLDRGADFLPALDRAEHVLRQRTSRIDGASVERKRYSVAVHYRQVADKDVPSVEKQVDQVIDETGSLIRTSGKKVFDLRPDLDWHKGEAVDWLLDQLGAPDDRLVAIYIGDDVTDEDAFRTLAGRGITVAVQDPPAPTAAEYRLDDPAGVQRFLDALVDRLADA